MLWRDLLTSWLSKAYRENFSVLLRVLCHYRFTLAGITNLTKVEAQFFFLIIKNFYRGMCLSLRSRKQYNAEGNCVMKIFMCCWPCILVMIKFRSQLNAQYFISIVKLLYMFRALLRPSSGGLLHIYNIWFYVSTQPKDKKRKIRSESRFSVSCHWVVYWHRTRCCKYAEVLLRMGARLHETCRGA